MKELVRLVEGRARQRERLGSSLYVVGALPLVLKGELVRMRDWGEEPSVRSTVKGSSFEGEGARPLG